MKKLYLILYMGLLFFNVSGINDENNIDPNCIKEIVQEKIKKAQETANQLRHETAQVKLNQEKLSQNINELKERINLQAKNIQNLREQCDNLFSLKLPSISFLFESLKSFSINSKIFGYCIVRPR